MLDTLQAVRSAVSRFSGATPTTADAAAQLPPSSSYPPPHDPPPALHALTFISNPTFHHSDAEASPPTRTPSPHPIDAQAPVHHKADAPSPHTPPMLLTSATGHPSTLPHLLHPPRSAPCDSPGTSSPTSAASEASYASCDSSLDSPTSASTPTTPSLAPQASPQLPPKPPSSKKPPQPHGTPPQSAAGINGLVARSPSYAASLRFWKSITSESSADEDNKSPPKGPPLPRPVDSASSFDQHLRASSNSASSTYELHSASHALSYDSSTSNDPLSVQSEPPLFTTRDTTPPPRAKRVTFTGVPDTDTTPSRTRRARRRSARNASRLETAPVAATFNEEGGSSSHRRTPPSRPQPPPRDASPLHYQRPPRKLDFDPSAPLPRPPSTSQPPRRRPAASPLPMRPSPGTPGTPPDEDCVLKASQVFRAPTSAPSAARQPVASAWGTDSALRTPTSSSAFIPRSNSAPSPQGAPPPSPHPAALLAPPATARAPPAFTPRNSARLHSAASAPPSAAPSPGSTRHRQIQTAFVPTPRPSPPPTTAAPAQRPAKPHADTPTPTTPAASPHHPAAASARPQHVPCFRPGSATASCSYAGELPAALAQQPAASLPRQAAPAAARSSAPPQRAASCNDLPSAARERRTLTPSPFRRAASPHPRAAAPAPAAPPPSKPPLQGSAPVRAAGGEENGAGTRPLVRAASASAWLSDALSKRHARDEQQPTAELSLQQQQQQQQQQGAGAEADQALQEGGRRTPQQGADAAVAGAQGKKRTVAALQLVQKVLQHTPAAGKGEPAGSLQPEQQHPLPAQPQPQQSPAGQLHQPPQRQQSPARQLHQPPQRQQSPAGQLHQQPQPQASPAGQLRPQASPMRSPGSKPALTPLAAAAAALAASRPGAGPRPSRVLFPAEAPPQAGLQHQHQLPEMGTRATGAEPQCEAQPQAAGMHAGQQEAEQQQPPSRRGFLARLLHSCTHPDSAAVHG